LGVLVEEVVEFLDSSVGAEGDALAATAVDDGTGPEMSFPEVLPGTSMRLSASEGPKSTRADIGISGLKA
jgi:hypothetical protein